ncbi:FAA hydrolase family protein [Mesobaculum littorinae]|uniref:FAA hydrolase family protein n=1 Tax=Mesobaculum littorinae TaxID=2486419 RepID=A0A438AMD4_9RHOB|nr:fumarylacetoacetate hydrolase family protein [Mesobaculum littorinae]RVV99810.1 FAA hydrolase family protein [Mesobaculum littorinae]
MRFVRFGPRGEEKPGVIDDDGQLRDLSAQVADLSGEVLARLTRLDVRAAPVVADSPRLGVPVAGVGKIVCVGMNYSDHARENGMQPPREPILFLKATTALCGPTDPIIRPLGSEMLDWEVELGAVISRRTRYVDEAQALDHVAGYVAINDLSDRSYQLERAGQWTKGKSADSFAPVGPWLVPPRDAGDPQDLALRLWVNGVLRQDGSSARMIFPVARLVSYASQFMTLEPGDILATGTPKGVGMGQRPPVYLVPGDVVELEVEGLGRQRQVVEDEPAA